MKFLAILKDSLREALDTKVFYVMVGLSLLAVLFVASVGYRPVSVEDQARQNMARTNWILQRAVERSKKADDKNKSDEPPPTFDVQDFEQTNPGAPPWQTGYRFSLTVTYADADKAKAARLSQKLPFVRQKANTEMGKGLQAQFAYLKNIKVTDAEPKDPKEMRYLVTAEGAKSPRYQDWPHEVVLFFFLPVPILHLPIGTYVQFWEDTLINTMGASIALLISTVITAFFIPNMLRKGTVDLLVVKPISRWALLLSKYIGGLTFIFLNTVVVVAGIWLVLGLRTNLWGTGFLFSIGVLTFQFAVYYAVSTLFGVLTRSPIVSILMACLFWFVFVFLIGYGYQIVDATRKVQEVVQMQAESTGQEVPSDQTFERPFKDWVYTTADLIHLSTPHLKDLDVLTSKWILEDVQPAESPQRKAAEKLYANFRWTEALTVTALYIIVLLALACWRFATRDY
jgi:ABC-type transport system involved in multi-copper enzyme maturation permease subunit